MDYLKKLTQNQTYNYVVIGLLVLVIMIAVFRPSFFFPAPPMAGGMEGFKTSNDDDGNKTFAFFGVNWCGHCRRAKPEWEKFQKNMEGKGGKIVFIDCDENAEMAKKHSVSSYPTIKYFPNGLDNPENAKEYNGDRTADAFAEFWNKQ